jgi:beta-galactosidase
MQILPMFEWRQLRLLGVAGCLLVGWLPAATGDRLRAEIAITGAWQVQPATSPETPPNDADWGRSPTGSWKAPSDRANTSWKAADLRKINSVWFQKTFDVPANWRGRRIVADFRRIEGDALVFLNGRRVTELLRPGGEVTLTDFIRYGEPNTLRLFLTRDYTGISRTYEQDVLRYHTRTREKLPMAEWGLGITAPVTLTARPQTAIDSVFVIPSWRKKALSLEVEIHAHQPLAGAQVEATVFDQDKKPVLQLQSGPLSLAEGKSIHTVSSAWPDPIPWELDCPYLYTVEVRLVSGGKVMDEFPPETFGFREIRTEGNKLMMNGHPSRWRLTEIYGANAAGLSVYRLLGYNVGQLQPHPDLWWQGKWAAETPVIDKELLREMDRRGMGVTLPAPSVSYLRENFRKPGVAEAYERETAWFLKKYRNHPSVLGWVVAMNSYVPQSAIVPENLGVREKKPGGQGVVINSAVDIVRRHDPTRLAFAHADGGVGDIATANTYLNFAPLQEREEWPMAWARNGDMPYQAVEFGAPYPANYWKGKQFLLTEYLAVYLGDRAYREEGEDGLRKTIDYGLLNTGGHGAWRKIDLTPYPAFWDFLNLFVRNTDRAWRTWGINGGWLYFTIGERFGHPTLTRDVPTYEQLNYNFLKAPLTEKPAWASPNWDIFAQANRPLLVHLAGDPVPTDKTHAFFSGETVKKRIAVVWDGAKPTKVEADWALKHGEKILSSGTATLGLPAGEIRFAPITFALPQVEARTELSLELTARHDGRILETDRFPLEVFPRPAPVAVKARLALYDPSGKSGGGLKNLGLDPRPWKPGDGFGDVDVLIIGREAIDPGNPLPYRSEDIRAGLRVLFLAQHPLAWRSIGFETIETMPRYVFARDTGSPLLAGLKPEDLINWRGAPDLLPEGRQVVPSDAPHAPKGTNRHAVASVVLKTPHVAGFTPLIEAEFDLAYTPLLEWRDGRGGIWFCTVDFDGRLGTDPAATFLAGNMIETLSSARWNETLPVHLVGGDGEGLRRLGFDPIPGLPAEAVRDAILVVEGETPAAIADRSRAFADKGGTVLYIGRPEKELQAAGLKTLRRTLYRATPDKDVPLLRGMGPNLLRWQDALEGAVFAPDGQPAGARVLADGLLLERKSGQGREIDLRVFPALLEARHADNADKREAIQLSVLRLHRLMAQLLTNLGATPAPAIAQRLAVSRKAPAINTLGSWRVLGPFLSMKEKGYQMLNEKFPGEWEALHGAENPNTVYRLPDGSTLDWRRTVEAGKDGFVDLGAALGGPKHGRVAYVTRSVESDQSRTVAFHLGVDYWLQFWVNGQSVLKVDDNHGSPVPDAFKVNAPLKKGKNILTLKVVAGTNGFGFWCRMKTEDSDPLSDREAEASLYMPPFRTFDPYQFTYW